MIQVLSLEVFEFGREIRYWWQWTLVVIIGVSGVIGIASLIWTAYEYGKRYTQRIKSISPLPRRATARLEQLARTATPLRSGAKRTSKPASFGVYLGKFSNPVTEAQSRMLTKWEAIILDPVQEGVLQALSSPYPPIAGCVIGRLDLASVLHNGAMKEDLPMTEVIEKINQWLQINIQRADGRTDYTGLLIASWENLIPSQFLNGLAQYLNALGLDAYLETAPPDFLANVTLPAMELFSGMVVRNATILDNGERRDFFQMDKLKSTIKAFVTQSCLRSFSVMMWETIGDDVQLSHAVARRSHMWCNYYGALTSIASTSSLADASLARPEQEPLAAFQWLKESDVMKIHEAYRSNRQLSRRPNSDLVDAYMSLEEIVPSVKHIVAALNDFSDSANSSSTVDTLTGRMSDRDSGDGWASGTEPGSIYEIQKGLDWLACLDRHPVNPLSNSPSGASYDSLGCFPVGLDASIEDFNAVIKSQQRLRKLDLLRRVPAPDLRKIGSELRQFASVDLSVIWSGATPAIKRAIGELAQSLDKASETDAIGDPTQVYVTLDSGLHTSGDSQFWAIYEIDRRYGSLIFYLSKSAQDVASTLLHTFLSSRSFQRHQCFHAEIAFDRFRNGSKAATALPQRIVQDFDLLAPSDILLFLQHIKLSYGDLEDEFIRSLRLACEERLIDEPTFKQLKILGNCDYIGGTASDTELINSRISWYRQQNCDHLEHAAALEVFRDMDRSLLDILNKRRYADLDSITAALDTIFSAGTPDAFADILAFSIFSAAKRASFEEIYLEVTDRNPLFNEYSDQSAAFAELFALGSRCEAYFDISPSSFGKLLSNKHRAHYQQPENQPPMWIHNAPAFATSYAAAQTDIDSDQRQRVMPGYRRFTYLSVFAIPALIDIILLTTTGRGLYLSAFMSMNELQNATLALMLALLLSGAVGTWISIGGTYYLISMAFSAANMFVLTRFIGGMAFTVAGGLVGLIVISAIERIQAGIVFFLYLLGLTSYLSLLAVLSSFQFPGSSFLNGRMVIIMLMPTLAISPIMTVWVRGHDVVIYLTMLYIFILLLLMGTRYVGTQWVSWMHKITLVDDAKVKQWYLETKAKGEKEVFAGMTEPAVVNLCRENLYNDVMKEKGRRFWTRKSEDALVRKLAGCWEATVFLIDWYCRVSEVKQPIPYSSTWNIETRVALDSLLQNQKGIRLHNSFIHWRNAGDEIGCGVLYFIVALLDRWVEIIYGGSLVGLSAGETQSFRIAIGFGLAYYLIGAVLLDYKAQHLHQKADAASSISIPSKHAIKGAVIANARDRQKLYWVTLLRFLGVHAWVLSLTAAFIWVFSGTSSAVITYLAYVGAYTGLLLYQYNKIFSGPKALGPLLIAVFTGLPLGLFIRGFLPHWIYGNVIALAVCTWLAALLSFRSAKVGRPGKSKIRSVDSGRFFRAYGGIGGDHEWSQAELEAIFDGVSAESEEYHFRIYPSGHPGVEIRALLLSCGKDSLRASALDAFPNISDVVEQLVHAWDAGRISVEFVPMSNVINPEADIRALCCYQRGHLHIMIASDAEHQAVNVSSNCLVVAETILRSCAETMFGFTTDHACIAEALLASRFSEEGSDNISERFKTAVPMEASDSDIAERASYFRRELLRHLCLGIRSDITWDDLPQDIRVCLLKRCLGESNSFSPDELLWLHSNLVAEEGCELETRIARYDFGALVNVQKYNYFKTQWPQRSREKVYRQEVPGLRSPESMILGAIRKSWMQRTFARIKKPFAFAYHLAGTWIKFFFISWMGDPEFQRELACTLSSNSDFVQRIGTVLFNGIWIYATAAQSVTLPFFLYHSRPDIRKLWNGTKGTVTKLKRGRVVIQEAEKTSTGFIHNEHGGYFLLRIHAGLHSREPTDSKTLESISRYSRDMRLRSREEYEKGTLVNRYVYEYHSRTSKRQTKMQKFESRKIPMSRKCVEGKNEGGLVQYNHKGHVESGSYMHHENLIRFNFRYRKNAKYGDELLRAEFVLPHVSCNVNWSAPPVRHPEKMERWIPNSRVIEATFVQGSDVYESNWIYDHKHHPTIKTRLNGFIVDTPPMIRYDWLNVLKKPTNTTFAKENPLYQFNSVDDPLLYKILGRGITRRLPVSTSRNRTQLWKAWKKNPHMDAITVRWLDERLLRIDNILKPYWRLRDRGALAKAEHYIALHADAIMASSDLSNDISAWTPLAIKMNDLVSFGQGGDAVVYTRTKTLQKDTANSLHVIAVDTGTWPNEGGGVSACRRDMINNLKTIKWHMIAEAANDFGLPKHQIEENVQSLKVIPLWGLDYLHPVHGMFFNKLDSEVDRLPKDASNDDIRRNFIPTLTALVKGARTVNLTQADVKQATRALVNLNSYFEDSRHWSAVWTSDIVKQHWRELWLADDLPNVRAPSEWFDTEHPTLGHLESAMDLWFRYLFIFSIPIPDQVPSVFQASHHSVSAAYGIVCKIKRQCTLQIWDHAISWRETNLYLSSALCTLPPFIRNSLLGLMRLTSLLVLHHADQVLPCADFFNPGWEVEIGTSQGTIEHRNKFKRKIDPIVNGIADMQKFAPISEIKTEKPTVTMLSHVWYAKDIKTALLAADIVVNEWGFEDYSLDIYGALNKAPIYSSECQEIIASKGLVKGVNLKGTADPAVVLANTWVFLNSSISEGLPLALGEAALTGAPVVCTDVGASLRVLTDPDDNERYSAVVAPNDAYALARAQISLLAMIGEWSKYAEDDPSSPAPVLPHKPTREDVAVITRRMYEKSPQRRKLGMMARNIVQKSFSGDRYLREHEQMLWVGKARHEMLGITPPPEPTAPSTAAHARWSKREKTPLDEQLTRMEHPLRPWVKRHHSIASSFTSGVDNDREPRSSLLRPSYPSSSRTSFTSVDLDNNSMFRRDSYYPSRPATPLSFSEKPAAPARTHQRPSSKASWSGSDASDIEAGGSPDRPEAARLGPVRAAVHSVAHSHRSGIHSYVPSGLKAVEYA